MTHDPLCPYRPEYQGQGATTPYVASIQYATHVDCQCELIAKVRKDMLAKCIAMVDDLASDDWYWPRRRLMARLLALQEKP
jgi:hypothetical protein